MIIERALMVQLSLLSEFKHYVLQWDGVKVPMKEPSGLLGKTDISSCDMREVVIQTSEAFSDREATERLVNILDSTYVKADL